MNQTHMGHVSWNDPAVNKMPEVSYIQTKPTAGLGYMLESGLTPRGSRFGMSNRSFTPFDALNNQTYFIEIYNTGLAPLNYTISSKNDWIKLSEQKGSVQFEE